MDPFVGQAMSIRDTWQLGYYNKSKCKMANNIGPYVCHARYTRDKWKISYFNKIDECQITNIMGHLISFSDILDILER